MATVDKRIERAAKILRLLPASERNSILGFIEFLAEERDVDWLLDEDRVEQHVQAVKRFRGGDRTGTVTLGEVCRKSKEQHIPAVTH